MLRVPEAFFFVHIYTWGVWALFCFFSTLVTFYSSDPLSFVFFIHAKSLVIFIQLIPGPYPCQGVLCPISFNSLSTWYSKVGSGLFHPFFWTKCITQFWVQFTLNSTRDFVLLYSALKEQSEDRPFPCLENISKTNFFIVQITKMNASQVQTRSCPRAKVNDQGIQQHGYSPT